MPGLIFVEGILEHLQIIRESRNTISETIIQVVPHVLKLIKTTLQSLLVVSDDFLILFLHALERKQWLSESIAMHIHPRGSQELWTLPC